MSSLSRTPQTAAKGLWKPKSRPPTLRPAGARSGDRAPAVSFLLPSPGTSGEGLGVRGWAPSTLAESVDAWFVSLARKTLTPNPSPGVPGEGSKGAWSGDRAPAVGFLLPSPG